MADCIALHDGERGGARGCYLPVKARPGGRRNEAGGVHDGALRVEVTAAPEKGKANKAIVKLLAQRLKIAPGRIELVSGETDQRKVFFLGGLNAPEVQNALGDAE